MLKEKHCRAAPDYLTLDDTLVFPAFRLRKVNTARSYHHGSVISLTGLVGFMGNGDLWEFMKKKPHSINFCFFDHFADPGPHPTYLNLFTAEHSARSILEPPVLSPCQNLCIFWLIMACITGDFEGKTKFDVALHFTGYLSQLLTDFQNLKSGILSRASPMSIPMSVCSAIPVQRSMHFAALQNILHCTSKDTSA